MIRREFRLAEGDAFNSLMVDRAKKRLKALGIFKDVDIKRRPGSAPDRVVLDVMVQEQSTGELSFGAGLLTAQGTTFNHKTRTQCRVCHLDPWGTVAAQVGVQVTDTNQFGEQLAFGFHRVNLIVVRYLSVLEDLFDFIRHDRLLSLLRV